MRYHTIAKLFVFSTALSWCLCVQLEKSTNRVAFRSKSSGNTPELLGGKKLPSYLINSTMTAGGCNNNELCPRLCNLFHLSFIFMNLFSIRSPFSSVWIRTRYGQLEFYKQFQQFYQVRIVETDIIFEMHFPRTIAIHGKRVIYFCAETNNIFVRIKFNRNELWTRFAVWYVHKMLLFASYVCAKNIIWGETVIGYIGCQQYILK